MSMSNQELPDILNQLGDDPGNLERYAEQSFLYFLKEYTVQGPSQDEQTQPVLYYAQQVETMKLDDSTTLYVNWSHFMDYNTQIADVVVAKWYRLEPSLRKSALEFVRSIDPNYAQVRRDSGSPLHSAQRPCVLRAQAPAPSKGLQRPATHCLGCAIRCAG